MWKFCTHKLGLFTLVFTFQWSVRLFPWGTHYINIFAYFSLGVVSFPREDYHPILPAWHIPEHQVSRNWVEEKVEEHIILICEFSLNPFVFRMKLLSSTLLCIPALRNSVLPFSENNSVCKKWRRLLGREICTVDWASVPCSIYLKKAC